MLEIRSTPSATEDKLDDPPHRRFFLWLFFLLFFFVCVKRRNWNEIEQFQQLLPTANPRRCSEQIRNSSVSLADLDFVFFFARIFFFKENSETPTLRLQWRISMERSATTAIDSKELFFGLFFFLKLSDWRLDVDGCWLMLKQRQTSRDRDRDDDWSHNPDINSEDDPGEIVSRTSFSFFFTEFYWVFRTVTPGLSWFYLVLPGFTVRLCFFLSRYCFGVNRFF